jgi:hypothetical protein
LEQLSSVCSCLVPSPPTFTVKKTEKKTIGSTTTKVAAPTATHTLTTVSTHVNTILVPVSSIFSPTDTITVTATITTTISSPAPTCTGIPGRGAESNLTVIYQDVSDEATCGDVCIPIQSKSDAAQSYAYALDSGYCLCYDLPVDKAATNTLGDTAPGTFLFYPISCAG